MPISGRRNLLDDIEESKVLDNSVAAIKQELLQPDLPQERQVEGMAEVNDLFRRIVDTAAPADRAERKRQLRDAVMAYAPERLKATFEFPQSETVALGLYNHVEGIVGNEHHANELIAAVNMVINNIAEREIDLVLADKKKGGSKGTRSP